MKKKKTSLKKKVHTLPVIYMGGFLLGILIPCFLWKAEIPVLKSTSLYFLAALEKEKIPGREYLQEIVSTKGAYWLLLVLSGLSTFGIPLALVTIIFQGFFSGAVVTLSILQFGLLGGGLGLLLLLPQYLLYVPVTIILTDRILRISGFSWKSRQMTGRDLCNYGLSAILLTVWMALGILGESYINPLLIKFLVSNWKIF